LTNIDPKKEPKTINDNGELIYEQCENFEFSITREEILEKFITFSDEEYNWKSSEIYTSNIKNILLDQESFPSQIAPSIRKTYPNFRVELYCGGCVGNRNEKTAFNAQINIQDLVTVNSQVNIKIVFSKNKNVCRHLEGKRYGQLRGLNRKTFISKNQNKEARHMQQIALTNIKPEQRLTGNRHNVPSAYSARTLKSQSNLRNPQVRGVAERLLFAVTDINEKEKENYINSNGKEASENRKIWGYIQQPLTVWPLSVLLFNEASITYYHYFCSINPGIFIDYTGQLVK
jgi:hypothetical protein